MKIPHRWTILIRAPYWINQPLSVEDCPPIPSLTDFRFESSVPESVRERLTLQEFSEWSHRVSKYAEFELEQTLSRRPS